MNKNAVSICFFLWCVCVCVFLKNDNLFSSIHRKHNALNVIAAMQDIGLDFPLMPEDIYEPSPCFMVIFVAFLFQQLPLYLVAQDVTFSGAGVSFI